MHVPTALAGRGLLLWFRRGGGRKGPAGETGRECDGRPLGFIRVACRRRGYNREELGKSPNLCVEFAVNKLGNNELRGLEEGEGEGGQGKGRGG